jgi:hypothetical protein
VSSSAVFLKQVQTKESSKDLLTKLWRILLKLQAIGLILMADTFLVNGFE